MAIDLEMELDEALSSGFDCLEEEAVVECARIGDDKVGVLGADLGAADFQPFEPGAVDVRLQELADRLVPPQKK